MNIIAINGSPLSNRITGIERYMYEILKRLDSMIKFSEIEIYLLCPKGRKMNIPKLETIEAVYLKSKRGKLSVFAIRKFLREHNAIYCTMSGNLCIQKGAIICIHDIRPWIYKEYDPFMFRLRCAINFLSCKLLSGKIVTVSETSKKEMIQYLKMEEKKITVISNGWEHMTEIEEDMAFWDKHKEIEPGKYYYSLGSQAPHKNFKWITENAKNNPDAMFVVAGKVWEHPGEIINRTSNIVYLGYVSDDENKTLMKHCMGFIHPSRYEGFGIPPLEALACGIRLYVANASCLPEIFKDVAVFFHPDNYDFVFTKEDSQAPSPELVKAVLDKYKWEQAAIKWKQLFLDIER